MGYNLISGCHNCKEKQFHFRNEESKTILPFYMKHLKCIRINQGNVETILDNMENTPLWAAHGIPEAYEETDE